MPSYQSVSTKAFEVIESSGSPLVVTKPSGLTAGDLMIAHISGINPSAGELELPTPGGWTLGGQDTAVHNGCAILAVFYKIATSDDAAASSFSFSNATGSPLLMGGAIYRVSGTGSTITVSIDVENTNTSTPSFSNTVTPTVASSLLLFLVTAEGSGAGSVASYAVTTDNPSWTERYDFDETGQFSESDGDALMGGATATRVQTTATGNSSCTLTGINTCSVAAMVVVSIGAPTVTTQAASSVTYNSATGNGNITMTGGENADIRGIVYDTVTHVAPGNVAPASSGYPDKVEELGSFGTGAFTESLTSLDSKQVHYARAYAHNSQGYSYGDEISFVTMYPPNTTIAAVTNPKLGEVAVWRNRILYGLDQPNTTYTQNDDPGGVWMIGNSEPQLPIVNSLYFMVSATSAAPYRPWGVRTGALYADQTNTIKVAYQDTQATSTSASYHIGTLDNVFTATNSQYAYYVTLPINCDTDVKKIFHSIRPTMSGQFSSTMGVSIYYRLDVDATSLYDNDLNSLWTFLRTVTTATNNPTTPIRKLGKTIQFKFVFVPASGITPQLKDYTLVFEPLDQYR